MTPHRAAPRLFAQRADASSPRGTRPAQLLVLLGCSRCRRPTGPRTWSGRSRRRRRARAARSESSVRRRELAHRPVQDQWQRKFVFKNEGTNLIAKVELGAALDHKTADRVIMCSPSRNHQRGNSSGTWLSRGGGPILGGWRRHWPAARVARSAVPRPSHFQRSSPSTALSVSEIIMVRTSVHAKIVNLYKRVGDQPPQREQERRHLWLFENWHARSILT